MKKYLEIARFTKTQGLKGELRAQTFCDSPEMLEDFDCFYIGKDKNPLEVSVRNIRKGFAVLKIEDINTVGEAEVFVGETLYINRDDCPLPEGSYFIQDLIGLNVINADSGEVYGTVEEILQNAPKDVYVVKSPSGRQLLFPSIPEVLIDIDITEGVIKIRPLEGLFDED